MEKIKETIPKLTLKDVNDALKKYISTANMDIAFVGTDAEGLMKALAENTPSPVKYDAVKPDSVLAEDKIIEKYPIPLSGDNITIVPVDKIFP